MGAQLPLLLAAAAIASGTALDTGASKRDDGGETALLRAARLGRAGHVRLVLELPGAQPTAADNGGRTALHHAALAGSAAMVHALLSATGVDVNARDSDGHTPLYYAIKGSHADAATALLDDGALDALARDAAGDTALHWAARAGNTDIVSAVLERAPALLNAEGGGGRTPLAIAVHNGHTESALRLLAVPSVQLRGVINPATVLHCAAAGGHVALVRTMLAIPGTDVNARDAGNATALMAAVWEGQTETADALLATVGVDVAAHDALGRTALMLAVEHDGTELLRMIMSSDGVDECATDSHGCAQRCVNAAVGYTCECYAGHELAADGRNCTRLRQAANVTTAGADEEGPAVACGGRVTGRRGTLTSPNYPNNYGSNERCTWDIVAPRGHNVYLDFTHMELEGDGSCGYDSVEVLSVDASGDTVERHGKFCGSTPPDRIVSVAGRLRLVFATDGSGERSGFAARHFAANCAGRPAGQRQSDCVSEASGGGGGVADCMRPTEPARSPYLGGL